LLIPARYPTDTQSGKLAEFNLNKEVLEVVAKEKVEGSLSR
jgi:hypothetical protein